MTPKAPKAPKASNSQALGTASNVSSPERDLVEDEADAVEEKQPGHINLAGLFAAEAKTLSSAVERGALLHATRNIAESGGPLETAFREFLRGKLPPQYGVEKGYFFDVDSTCTPQIDAMIVNMADRHQLLKTPDGSAYLPFTASRVVLEIKNSAYGIKKALDQIGAINDTLHEMWSKIPDVGTSPDRLSIMLFAETGTKGTLEQVRDWYERNQKYSTRPTYTVFLDQGIVITSLVGYDSGTVDQHVSLRPDQSAVIPYICVPAPRSPYIAGLALMWIYFSLAASLAEKEKPPGHILKLTQVFEQKFPLFPVATLASTTHWEELDKSIKTWQANKLAHDKQYPSSVSSITKGSARP